MLISLVISLTTTPMMCAWLLKPGGLERQPGKLAQWAERGFDKLLKGYEHSLDWALGSKLLVMLILAFVVGLNVYLFAAAPKGFFPQQDTGQINGGLRADQSISSQAMGQKLREVVDIVHRDPAVDTVVGFTGGSRSGGGFMFDTGAHMLNTVADPGQVEDLHAGDVISRATILPPDAATMHASPSPRKARPR